MWHKIAPPRIDWRNGAFSSSAKPVYYNRYDFKNVRMEPIWRHSNAVKAGLSRHNLLLYWFCVFLPLQIPDRQPFPALCPARQPLGRPCSMLSRFLGTLPGCPDHGAASPKAVRQRTLFSCGERKYIFPQLQWIASESGNGTGKIK